MRPQMFSKLKVQQNFENYSFQFLFTSQKNFLTGKCKIVTTYFEIDAGNSIQKDENQS